MLNLLYVGMLIAALVCLVIEVVLQKSSIAKESNVSGKVRFPMASIVLLLYCFQRLLLPVMYEWSFFEVFSISGIVHVVCLILLAVLLLMKKRNQILLLPLALIIALEIYWLIGYFNIADLLYLVCYVYLFMLIFSDNKAGEKYEKISQACKKVWLIPAILFIIHFIVNVVEFSSQDWIKEMMDSYYYSFGDVLREYIFRFVDEILYICFILLFCIWLLKPCKKECVIEKRDLLYRTVDENDACIDEAYCGLGKHIVLCLFTFGIWYLIWTYRTTKFLNKTPGAEQYNPTNKLLLCIFVPFYQIYWMYKHGQRIDTFSKYKKLNNSEMATMCLILGIFIPIVACILMQDRINALCMAKTSTEEASTETEKQNAPIQVVSATSAADELKKYKDLLDSGVITQEEFDAKKKQLLGL